MKNNKMKIKLWEIGSLFVFIIIIYLVFINIPDYPEPGIYIPEGAGDDYILEQAYIHADVGSCYLLEDEVKRDQCLASVQIKKDLDQSQQEVQEQYKGISVNDKRLLAKATIEKDMSLCEQIIDETIMQKCIEDIS